MYSVGRVNYSTRDSRLTDSIVGLEYDAGCWIGRVVVERLSTGRSEATTRLLLQLELVGLSRLGSNPLKILKDNITGYQLLRRRTARPTRLSPRMNNNVSAWRATLVGLVLGLAALHSGGQTVDYIVAVVNQELVTSSEVQARIARFREEAARAKQQLPPPAELRKQAVESLIEERVLVTNARDSNAKVDDSELDRAVNNVALQNQLTIAQLRDRLRQEGIDYMKFRRQRQGPAAGRACSRARGDQLDQGHRCRDRRDGRSAPGGQRRCLGDGHRPDPRHRPRRRQRCDSRRAAPACARRHASRSVAARTSGPFSREMSEDANHAVRRRHGHAGRRAGCPTCFVAAVRPLKAGEIAPDLVRSGAGFHVLKLVDRKDVGAFTVQQVRAPTHPAAAVGRASRPRRRRAGWRSSRSTSLNGSRTFEQLARANSEDGSAAQGGDLGWASPGQFVPEFEEAIAATADQRDIGSGHGRASASISSR